VTEKALVLEDVSVVFPASIRPSLDHCSFKIGASERVALLGLNGSGKTTLLLAAVGLVPCSGRIILGGQEVVPADWPVLRRKIGFLFAIPEDQLLLPKVKDDVELSLRHRRYSPSQASQVALRILEALGIQELAEMAPYQLSHGQRLMAALAGVLAPDPSLVLLDEPTSRLDPPARRRLAELLDRRKEALLIATHDLDFAAGLCDRYILLDQGRVSESGSDFKAVATRWGVRAPL
jgi:cobalt/nickel transport system ATP-binding protein